MPTATIADPVRTAPLPSPSTAPPGREAPPGLLQAQPPDAAVAAEAETEAARYTVLRRLGPALRHDLVVHLQAVAMMAEVLSARLERDPGAADLPLALARMHQLARDAVSGALRVASWLTPPEDDAVDLRQGLEESLALVRSSLGFRGLQLQADLPEAGLPVSRDHLRHLLLAALLYLSDLGGPAGALRVGARVDADSALLRLALEPHERPGDHFADRSAEGFSDRSSGHASERPPEPGALPALAALAGPGADPGADLGATTIAPDEEAGYRPLRWADVLALAEGVPLLRHFTPARIEMRLPRAVARTPLQVAPR